MKKIIFRPLVGMKIDGRDEIKFGMTKECVKVILGEPDMICDRVYRYDIYQVAIEFGKSGTVQFIEAYLEKINRNFQLELFDINPFEIVDEKLISLLMEKDGEEFDVESMKTSYFFKNIIVSLWREMTPNCVKEIIRELKENGEYEMMKEEIERDLIDASFFDGIGIGNEEYSSAQLINE